MSSQSPDLALSRPYSLDAITRDARITAATLGRRSDPDRNGRRVLTHDEAMALANTIVSMATEPALGVEVDHRVTTIARITQSNQVACAEVDRLRLSFTTHLGGALEVDINSNVRDLTTLKRVVKHAEARLTPPIRKEDEEEDDPDDPMHTALGARTYLPVTMWRETTQRAMNELQGDTIARMIAVMQRSNFNCAAMVGLLSRVKLRMSTMGKAAWGEETDSEITVTARTPDGKASGWSGQASRDWSKLHPEMVAQQAIDMANRNRGAVRMEPGRYTTILGAAAVGTLLSEMRSLFDIGALGPFHLGTSTDGKKTKIGQRVFDTRISLVSDPADPEYGDYPFFDNGYPSGKATWVENGVLKTLACTPGDAMMLGRTPIKLPDAICMSGGATSIEEMIAQCERGIYVHRLSSVELADQLSGAMLGTTRDGCFLIKNGKIHSPITNFRFYESPFIAFNKVLAIGVPERVAFGPPSPAAMRYLSYDDPMDLWPKPPIVVPPLMVQDFNFSALADAV